MYTPGFRFNDDKEPIDAITIAGDVLGLTMSLNNYAKDYFENGSNLGGFIEYPESLDQEAYERFRDDWAKAYTGVMNNHKWAILEGGFKLTQLSSNPTEAQALDSRKMQVEEVCRIWGVPPHKVFMLDRMTFNNVEQINIEYVQECLNPMAERLEQTMYKDLLTKNEQNKLTFNFNTNKLLKGDTQTRTAYYNSMRQNGVMSSNDIRELEEMNLIPEELGGNEYFVNGNMIPLSAAKLNLPKSAQQTKGGTNQ
jgi:HK97 family phage portal protein